MSPLAALQRPMQPERRDSELLRSYAEKIVESGQLGKSELYPKLLIYLVEASLKGVAPKEIDIALDVFSKDESFNVHEDSIVRVYVHSLRGKLDEYYRHLGQDDALRIDIPKGGYKVVGHPQPVASEPASDVQPTPKTAARKQNIHPALYGFIGLAFLVSVVGNIYFGLQQEQHQPDKTDEVSKTFVWAGLLKDRRPITVVLGDLYFYTEFDPELGRLRFIGDVPVNSRDSLRAFLKDHPDRAATLGPFDTTLLSKGTAYGLAAVLPILHRRHGDVKPAILDELDTADIRKNDVIFIGPLHRLGPLAAYYDNLSRYEYDRAENRLKDKKTGKFLVARSPMSRDGVDYGIFAGFRGPDGNRIMILASVASDIGLLQIVHSMTSKTELDHIGRMLAAQGAGETDSFEALFSATGYDRTDLTANIVEVHALRPSKPDANAAGS